MKIGLKLFETGYKFGSDERARIFLTNALEPKVKQLPAIGFDALAHEAHAVNEVKWYKRFTVVIGNPPYAGHSANNGDWIAGLLDNYYLVDGEPLGEKNPKWLQDDYVKFIRLGAYILSHAGYGVQSYITNHGYIDNPTFRGMRQRLMTDFSTIDVLDLHGNTTKKEKSPDGSADINVFDIKQGVAIFAARRRLHVKKRQEVVRHKHLFGTREEKYTILSDETLSSIELKPVNSAPPFYLFIPQNANLRDEYQAFRQVTQDMPVNVLGFQTHRDEVAVDIDKAQLLRKVASFLGKPPSNMDWNRFSSRCTYRLFDNRNVYLHSTVCDRPRRELLDHVLRRDNLCLGVGRQGIAVQDPVWSLVWVSRLPVDANIFRRGGISLFPLYLYPADDGLAFQTGRRPNFSENFLSALGVSLSLTQKSNEDILCALSPEDIFNYIYSVLHSPAYRTRYAEFLKIDFPRIPLPGSLDLFRGLAKLGGELVTLHLTEFKVGRGVPAEPQSKKEKTNEPEPPTYPQLTDFIGHPDQRIEKVTYSDETVWIDKAKTTGFRGVPEEVWEFHIGGYQVCEKWLKDRGPKKGNPGRQLTADDIAHYHKIVIALTHTIRLMAEIDQVIEQHGGWPGAFAAGGTA